jgi:hypothetical protein
MDKVYKYIKNGDKGTLQISDVCYESYPCQHYCYYITESGVKIELCFLRGNEIMDLLATGISAENILISIGKDDNFREKTINEIKSHFL